jgi:ParB/RepB/Spo0J family partition protein
MVLTIEEIDTSLSAMRLMRPAQVKEMARSLEQLGQLQPVVVREEGDKYQLIDGFKRYYASVEMSSAVLDATLLAVSEAVGKAMILNYNKDANSLVEYEEALITYSLKKDHMMDQKEISSLLGYSRAWVCRRIAMIEKLEQVVQDELRLGVITNSHTRSIIKLPRGNQREILEVITRNNLTSRQSSILIDKFIQTGNKKEQAYLLIHPMEAIKSKEKQEDIYDNRLSVHGNRLLKSIETLRTHQDMFIGQFTNHQTGQLQETEKTILMPKTGSILKKSQSIIKIITRKS